jgi:hypothetical protein
MSRSSPDCPGKDKEGLNLSASYERRTPENPELKAFVVLSDDCFLITPFLPNSENIVKS